jgi:antitoxin PrlF
MAAGKSASTITSKGQVTIPRSVREELGLQTGDRVVWSLHEDGSVVVRKANLRPLREIVGLLGRPSRSATVEEMDEAVRARFGAEHRAPRR